MTRSYFGTDGIRGRANAGNMTADVAMKVGMAAGIHFKAADRKLRVVIGKDTRLSGYMIETALTAGFTSVGCDVFLSGPIPTPAVAMVTRSLRADIGVMVSASHNPFHDNGIKLFGADGFKLSNKQESTIEALLQSDMSGSLAAADAIGRASRIDGLQDRYIEFAKRTFPRRMNLGGLRVVVDCGNGAAYKVAPQALWELGAEVISIGTEPDGYNINQNCGSTAPETLSEKVLEVRADIGIALDGDADRVIIVDEKGNVVDGDQLMAVVAESWRKQGRLNSQGIVATVMSNLGLERYLSDQGLSLERTQVGDKYVVEYMRKHDFNVGGEQSGHIVLSDFTTTGDGLVAALQIMAVVNEEGRPVSDVCNRFEPVPQLLKNVRISDQSVLEHHTVVAAIDSGKDQLGSAGRLVIRPSGTEPVVRVMAEGDDAGLVRAVVNQIADVLSKAA
jgi:phosphoglucosamine mutase